MSLPAVLEAVRQAEADAGRDPSSVRLIAVTKQHTPSDIQERVLAYQDLQSGGFPLAENRGQDLRDKANWFAEQGVRNLEWHFIGPLQLNKVKYMRPVSLVHALEELRQAEALAEAAQAWGRAPDVLLQVHNGEVQKHGIAPADLPAMLRQVQATGLNVRGLMVMAPYDQPEVAERLFSDTAARAHDLGLGELSMGMSDDFPQAIRCGATMVRIGRSLFT